METVELGDVRLHVVTTWPGLAGEADRVAREVARLDPAVVLADLDTEAALRLQQGAAEARPRFDPAFVDLLFQEEVARRYAPPGPPVEHPFLGVARVARNRRAGFLPLRPHAKEPGWLARRRARRTAAAIPACPVEDFGARFAEALRAAGLWDAAADVAASEPRVRRALEEGRGPLVALVQAHRADAYVEKLRALRRIRA